MKRFGCIGLSPFAVRCRKTGSTEAGGISICTSGEPLLVVLVDDPVQRGAAELEVVSGHRVEAVVEGLFEEVHPGARGFAPLHVAEAGPEAPLFLLPAEKSPSVTAPLLPESYPSARGTLHEWAGTRDSRSFVNCDSQTGCAGHAGAVTRFPSVTA